MNAVVSAIEPVARVVVAMLFNSLWEAALLALVVWAIVTYLPNINATTRYAAWWVALIGGIVLPLATTIPQVSVERPMVPSTTSPVRMPHINAAMIARSAAPIPTHMPAQTRPAPSAGFRLGRVRFALPDFVAALLFGAWIAVSLFLLLRLAYNLWRLERLKRDALPLPIDYRDALPRWSGAEKGGRDVRLCVSEHTEVPVAVGLFDSMVLIPRHLLDRLSQGEIDQITLHELAHLRRADDWTNGLQRIVQALFFFNPAILFVAQQLDLEREVACDDWVLRHTGEVRPYATCLTKMAEVTAWPHRALAAPGVFLTRRSLSVRVERLLRAGRNVRTSIAFGPAGALAAATIVLFFIAETIAPTFAFTIAQAPATKTASKVPVARPASNPKPKTITRYVYVAKQTTDQKQASAASSSAARAATVNAPPANSVSAPAPQRFITVPAQHVHVVPGTVQIPAVDVNIPSHTLPISFPKHYRYYTKMAPDQVLAAAGLGMDAARNALHGLHLDSSGREGCTGCDMTGVNWAGRNLRGASFTGADFKHADLHGADFTGASLNGVDFQYANLRNANFTDASLQGCDMHGADITGAIFQGARLNGCDIDVSRLVPEQARAVLHSCLGCDFANADLRNQDLRGISVNGDDFAGADLRGADLRNASFTGVDFKRAKLEGARLDGASFTGCDFTGVDLRNVDLTHVRMVGTNLSGAIMR